MFVVGYHIEIDKIKWVANHFRSISIRNHLISNHVFAINFDGGYLLVTIVLSH